VDSYEKGWLKFWLLTDGTIIPVSRIHSDTVRNAGISYDVLEEVGAIAGAITDDNNLTLRFNLLETKITSEQLVKVKELFKKYPIEQVTTFGERTPVHSDKELSLYLRTGTKPRRQEFESVDKNIAKEASTLSEKDFIDQYVEKRKGSWGTSHFSFKGNKGSQTKTYQIIGDTPEEVYRNFRNWIEGKTPGLDKSSQYVTNEDLSILPDPKLKKMFIQDKIEDLQNKIKDLGKLAKEEKKGFTRSNLFAKIDEKEIVQLKRSIE
jgi:hypothetical protein